MSGLFKKGLQTYFVVSLCLVSFAYGMAAERYHWFPFELTHHAKMALDDLLTSFNLESSKWVRPIALGQPGVTQWRKERAEKGMTFITRYAEEGFEAVLLDMAGRKRHRWYIAFSEVWPEATHVEYQAPDSAIHIHGAYLYPNGDVLLNFEDGNFPLGGGLVKIDKNSRVVWKLAENTHHSVHIDENKNIWVCAHILHNEPDERFPNFHPPFYEDFVYSISPAGQVLRRISMLETIYKSDKQSLLFINAKSALSIEEIDPLHLNDVETLHPEHADAFKSFNAGDILVSFAYNNTIAVIDAVTEEIKWLMTGPFLQQHDPDFLPDGNILLFDNRVDNHNGRLFGGSRILKINPVDRSIIISYSGDDENPFYTQLRGKEQMLPRGNILITEAEKGRVFEVTPDGEIVWQYINQVKMGFVGMVTQADRIPEKGLEFID